jgi:hypothetical protein
VFTGEWFTRAVSALREPARPSALGAFAPEPERAGSEPSSEQAGGLGIKERRSWQTWQLSVAVFMAILLGMAVGHGGGGGSSSANSAGDAKPAFKLPPRPDDGSPTPTTISSPAPPTTLASASPTTAARGPSGGSASGGPDAVLLPRTTGTGAQTLSGFTAAGPWKLGWAFQCASAPTFQIMVVPDGGSPPSQPAVDKADASGQGVSGQSTTGKLHLEVRAGPSCRWAVKASGAAG